MFSSITSLDEFLPMFHNKDSSKNSIHDKEMAIVVYLKSLGIIMKTDPLQKQQEYSKTVKIIPKQMSTAQLDDELERCSTEVSPNFGGDSEFNIENNPLIQRGGRKITRKHSFPNTIAE